MTMKNRWIAMYVENEVGVLAKVAGLFAGKSYNLHSLTVGTTEDETISRMTVGVTSDDITFEQVKKQLNRMVEVIKVMDLTDTPTHMKELLYVKINHITPEEKAEVFAACGGASLYRKSVFEQRDYGCTYEFNRRWRMASFRMGQ